MAKRKEEREGEEDKKRRTDMRGLLAFWFEREPSFHSFILPILHFVHSSIPSDHASCNDRIPFLFSLLPPSSPPLLSVPPLLSH